MRIQRHLRGFRCRRRLALLWAERLRALSPPPPSPSQEQEQDTESESAESDLEDDDDDALRRARAAAHVAAEELRAEKRERQRVEAAAKLSASGDQGAAKNCKHPSCVGCGSPEDGARYTQGVAKHNHGHGHKIY